MSTEEKPTRCKVYIQTGSINGEPKFTLVGGIIEKRLNGFGDYKYQVRVGDKLYYTKASELWVNLQDILDRI